MGEYPDRFELKVNQVLNPYIESPGNLVDIYQRHVLFGPFNHTDIGPVELGPVAELFLRIAETFPLAAYPAAELDENIMGHSVYKLWRFVSETTTYYS